MKKLLLLLGMAVLCLPQSEACTSILVGKNASVDGSVMCTYNIDSWGAMHKMYRYEAGKHPAGTMRKIYDRDSRVYHGQIPEAQVTYLVNGNINEWQVAIGETTFDEREELIDDKGIIDYGSLMDLGLQRSRTAREAIKVMTSLVEKYGMDSRNVGLRSWKQGRGVDGGACARQCRDGACQSKPHPSCGP